MGNFMTYLLKHHLHEVTELFPSGSMNRLFQQEIEKVLPIVEDPKVKADLLALVDVDFVGYLDRSLRGAGFSDEQERDALVHDLFVKWLVTPGGLVSKWKMDAPLSFRFKRAVKNAISTLVVRASTRRRRFGEMPDDQIQDERPRDDDDLITDFRRWLEDHHGNPAVLVFDTRLEGGDIKQLIGSVDGIPSSYALKRIVQLIKSSAVRWTTWDPLFQEKVRRLMDREQATLAKRFGRTGAGAAV